MRSVFLDQQLHWVKLSLRSVIADRRGHAVVNLSSPKTQASQGIAADEGVGWRRIRRIVIVSVWMYVAVILGIWLLLRFGGDRWWLATLLLFGPRWLCVVPIAVLMPMAVLAQRKLLWVLAWAAAFVLFAILGFRVPLARVLAPSDQRIRVLTYNTWDSAVPAPALSALIRDLQPDIVALQECFQETYTEIFADWHVCREGELLLAARFPIQIRRIESSNHPPHKWPRTTLLECVGQVNGTPTAFATVHLPSPRYGLANMMDRTTLIAPSRRNLLDIETANRDVVSSTVAKIVDREPRDRIVMGDFNMPTDSALYRRDWSGYTNAFTTAGWGLGHTMRPSVRGFGFGIRIDQVLASGVWAPIRCWVGPDLGSDHRPVIADLAWQGSISPSPKAEAEAVPNPIEQHRMSGKNGSNTQFPHNITLGTWTKATGQ
jgi:vancomycin resistance protein VanJ